ncbi:MAG: helix-turn-helix transcriptional regulator [Clostridia bacterium]
MEVFAERIKFLRKEKSLSLMSLAKILNVSDTAILKWECNKSDPTAENIKNIAVFFDVSSDFLLGLENFDGTKI